MLRMEHGSGTAEGYGRVRSRTWTSLGHRIRYGYGRGPWPCTDTGSRTDTDRVRPLKADTVSDPESQLSVGKISDVVCSPNRSCGFGNSSIGVSCR